MRAMLLLSLMAFFLFADQNLLAPNLTQAARDLGLDDVQRDVLLGGHISAAFWLLGGAVSLVVGYWTDRVRRKPLLVAILLLGELPCALTSQARTYEQLFWLRALTGIGLGGALPLIYSLLGDLFPAHRRATASALINGAMGLGIAMGHLTAGTLGPAYGWRLPFLLIALPNFVLAPLFALWVREPERGAAESVVPAAGHAAGRLGGWSAYREIFRIPTNRLLFLQGLPGTVPWSVFAVFLNDYYAQDKGYSVTTATLLVMSIGGAAILGSILGGLLGSRLYSWRSGHLPLLCGASTLLATVPMFLLLGYPSQKGVAEPSLALPILLGVLAGGIAAITGPNAKAMLLNVNAPETRGSVFSLYVLADNLGNGLGPAIIGVLIAQFGRSAAFQAANGFWVFCGVVLLCSARTFPRDEAALRVRLARAA